MNLRMTRPAKRSQFLAYTLALLLSVFISSCSAENQTTIAGSVESETTGPENSAIQNAGLLDFDFFPTDKPLKADHIKIDKSERRLDLMKNGKRIRSYRISLGGNPVGHKQREGDSRTPEGKYIIDWRNPKSKYHLSLHISYPNREDRARAKKKGVSPGGDIMIHGLPNGWVAAGPALAGVDWTDGCIAVDNWAIEEIWEAVPNGTPITIHP